MRAVWSSRERKAADAAALLAEPLGLEPRKLEQLAENDRSSTGYLPPELFEPALQAFFGEPLLSHRGWETAAAAQERIADALETVLARSPADGDVAIVSHGAVGTLLLCLLKGTAIHRAEDQPGQGHWFAFDRETRRVLHGWRPLWSRSTAAAQPLASAWYKPGMPYPGPRRATPPAVALCLLGLALLAAIPASASAQGYTCEASALAATLGPSPRTEPVTANEGAEHLQGRLRRREHARVAAADHGQPAVGDHRPPAAHRLAVRADRDRRGRPRRAAHRRAADPAAAPGHQRLPGPDRRSGRRDLRPAAPSRRSSRSASTPSC